jgi:hypothetical protein
MRGLDEPDTREYRGPMDDDPAARAGHLGKGMFANKNSVARMRSSFTLERLADRFELSGEEDE